MADNVTIPTTGTGTATPVIATDDVASVHYQKVKIALGADGAIDTLLDSGQQTMANSAPVALASDHSDIKITLDGETVTVNAHAVTNAGTFVVQENGAALTALQLIDDTVFAEDAAAQAGDKGIQVLAVRRDADTSLVGADNDYAPLQVNANGALKVEIFDGGDSHTIDGTVTANLAAGTNNIGDVDVLTVPAPLNLTGGGVEASALRVTLASDSTGVLSVDDNGGSLTVDGSVVVSNIQDGAGDSVMDATNNAIRVNIVAGAAAGGTSITDDGAFTPASSALTPIGGMFDDVSPDTIDEGDAGVARMTSYRALHVNLRDNSGNELAVGGGTQYAEDAAAAANPVGTAVMLVRDDSRVGSITNADGDNVAARGNNKGEMYVKDTDAETVLNAILASLGYIQPDTTTIVTETGNSATSLAIIDDWDESDRAKVNIIAGQAGVTAGAGAVAANTPRVTLASNDPAVGTLGDIFGDTQDINVNMATVAGATKPEDAAHSTGDTGIPALAVRRDTAAVGSGTDGDYSTVNVDGSGRLWTHDPVAENGLTNIYDVVLSTAQALTSNAADQLRVDLIGAIPAGTNNIGDVDILSIAAGDNNIGNVDIVTVPAPLSTTGGGTEATALRVTVASDSTGVLSVDDNGSSLTVDGTVTASNTAGDVANDAADSGNPVKVGSVAYNFDGTVPGTAVAEGDRVNQIADVYGRQFVETTHPNYWTLSADYASAQTNTSLKTAPGASLKLYITDVIISNGATAGNVTLLDGSGGTVKLELYPGVNGGLAISFRTPIALTANTALVITSTTVTTHSVTICGYTAP